MAFIRRLNLRLDPDTPNDVELERLIKQLRAGTRHRKIKEALRGALGKSSARNRGGDLDREAEVRTTPHKSTSLPRHAPPDSVPFDPAAMVNEVGAAFDQPWSDRP